jgi:hypothetical protein
MFQILLTLCEGRGYDFSIMTRAVLLVTLLLSGQEAKQEVDLAWKLPHDRAAVYEVHDGATGARKGDFWLLGCELEKRVGSTDFSDLPFRYVFRLPAKRTALRASWPVQEIAYGDLPVHHPGISPVEVAGSYRLSQIKKVRLEDLFKAATKGRKEKSEPVEVAIVEGSFELFRCNWVEMKVSKAEKIASTTLTVTIAVRVSDGVILGGRYQINGRNEMYEGKWSGPRVGRSVESREVLFEEPLVELTKAGLKPRIDEAVDRGVKWLKSQQGGDGCISDNGYGVGSAQGTGATAMSALALMHSGVPPDDPVVKKAFAYLASKKLNQSYDLALYLMAIEGKYLPLTMIEDVENYSEDKAREEIARKLTKEDRDAAERAVQALLATQHESGMFGYAGGAGYPNLSSTQYAVLGLKSASRMGISIPGPAWKKVLGYLNVSRVLGGNQRDLKLVYRGGEEEKVPAFPLGWGYIHPAYPSPTGTMTAAALTILAVAGSELTREKNLSERDAKNLHESALGALAWLQENYGIRAGTPEGCGYAAAMPYYYLYGLERASILADVRSLEGHDWYHEGAAVILSWQGSDGRWQGPHGTTVVDTAFALLFLKRATIPIETFRRKVASIDNTPKKLATDPEQGRKE